MTTELPAAAPCVAAVVVTYNRAALLVASVQALLAQSLPLAHIVIVDNASTDDTPAVMAAQGWLDHPTIICLRQAENTGGAGGFCAGIARCLGLACDWIWLTDDDAMAERDALAALFAIGPRADNVYGSAAVCRAPDGQLELCWPATLDGAGDGPATRDPHGLAAAQATPTLPFLGFLIATSLVRRIGLPDADFFISGDDIEYVLRARLHGAGSFIVRDSRLHHPRPSDYRFKFAGRDFFCLQLPPWRRYFYVRNKVVIARRHLGWSLYTSTLPGLLVRLLATLLREPERWRQLHAYRAGLCDGWRGRLGNPVARRAL